MKLRTAMRVLTDGQLLAVHENAQKHVVVGLQNDYVLSTVGYARQARAAEREIIARGRYADARNHELIAAVKR